jgi:hypothetical protein
MEFNAFTIYRRVNAQQKEIKSFLNRKRLTTFIFEKLEKLQTFYI